MSGKITNDVLESHLKCRYKGHLKTAGELGLSNDYEILMKESRERIRQAATARLLARYEGDEVSTGQPLTANLLKLGLPLLLDAAFEDEELSVRFDALLRLEGDSPLGSFHYQPVIFHETEKATSNLRMLLTLQGVILCGVQGKEPATGVLFQGRGCKERKAKLAGVVEQARRLLREIREARTAPPPRLVLNSNCQVCEFRQRCQTEATIKDDLSLLRGMAEKEIKKYAKRGVFTITQLSFAFRARRGRPPGQQKQVHQHALQALAIREKKVHILGTPEAPTSPTRIYFDIEGDPDRCFDYLLGLIVVADGVEQRHSFWADSPADEPLILRQFLDLVGRHLDAWLYTYGSYEAAFLRRVGKATGQEEEVGRVLARTFNVLSVIYQHVYFPVYSNGLKDIGAHLGFTWSEPDASGVQSVVWRRRWEETGSVALKDKLTTYNIEDCTSLRKVTEFLYATCAGQPGAGVVTSHEGHEVTRVGEAPARGKMHGWNESIHGVPEFGYIHDRASFDYLKDRICVRSGKTFKDDPTRKRAKKWKKNRRVNREIEISNSSCPSC